MKLMSKILIALCILGQTAFAGQEGNGGDGYNILWRQMAKQLQKELVMEVNKSDLQIRDVVPMDRFSQAIIFTDVESVDYQLIDNTGKSRTAIFLSPEVLKEEWRKDNVSEQEITRRLNIHPYGSIRLQRKRFKEEMEISIGVGFHLIFHEYLRVMGIDDDNYKVSEPIFEQAYFTALADVASPTTKRVIQSYADQAKIEEAKLGLAQSRIQRIEKEIEATDLKVEELVFQLNIVMDHRDEKIQNLRKAIEEHFNAQAELVETMGFAPMPFGGWRARVIKEFGEMHSAGLNSHQKMTEFQVIELQANHLIRSLTTELDWKEKIEAKRKERLWDTF